MSCLVASRGNCGFWGVTRHHKDVRRGEHDGDGAGVLARGTREGRDVAER
jgi:hypothetical protein